MKIILIILSAILYRLGGWKPFSWCKHNKLIRRIGLPILVFIALHLRGIVLFDNLVVTFFAFVVLTLPLGDDETLGINIVSALGLSLYSVYAVGLNWTNLVPFVTYFFCLWASKRFLNWWICELLIGASFILQVLK